MHLRAARPKPRAAVVAWRVCVSCNLRWAAQLACWCSVCSVALDRGRFDGGVSAFMLSMFLTGALAIILCPIGQSPLQDKIHWVASLLYMADHAIVFGILGTPTIYVAGFWSWRAARPTRRSHH